MSALHAAYSDIELSTEINTASSHRLIQMLLEKCIYHLHSAKKHIAENHLQNRNDSIRKASDIVIHLRQCLNVNDEKTKDLANLLDLNYHFTERCLLNATLTNEAKHLDWALIVFTNIKSAWDEIKK